jgi:hypothetical protein
MIDHVSDRCITVGRNDHKDYESKKSYQTRYPDMNESARARGQPRGSVLQCLPVHILRWPTLTCSDRFELYRIFMVNTLLQCQYSERLTENDELWFIACLIV